MSVTDTQCPGGCAGVEEDNDIDATEHDLAMCGGYEESCECECGDCVNGSWHNRGSWDWY